MTVPVWTPPAWRGSPDNMGEWWRLTKGSRVVTCTMWSHPLGAEMRCDVDGEMFGTQVGRNIHQLLDASDGWKAAFIAKGWTT